MLKAAARLKEKGFEFGVDIAAQFSSDAFREQVTLWFVEEHELRALVRFHGIVRGDAKDHLFRQADVFCFPSHFEAETLPMVLIEAMQYCLPVVATRWRGIPEAVTDEVTGYLIAPRDADATADRLARLLQDEGLRRRMGSKGRMAYEAKFSRPAFERGMQSVFDALR